MELREKVCISKKIKKQYCENCEKYTIGRRENRESALGLTTKKTQKKQKGEK